jgi:alpha-ketoglutarate-dependent 2,4-dichlorophenoxyacetate dioxygenase
MDVIPLCPGFGAELRGITLADVTSDGDACAAARAAFEEHSVLVLRDRDVTDEFQLAFSRRFGPPEAATAIGKLLRLARLRAFARQDRGRPCI